MRLEVLAELLLETAAARSALLRCEQVRGLAKCLECGRQRLPGRGIDLVVIERPADLLAKLGLREKERQTVRHLCAAALFPHELKESSIGFGRLVLQTEHNGMPHKAQRPVRLDSEAIVAQAKKELVGIVQAMVLQVI